MVPNRVLGDLAIGQRLFFAVLLHIRRHGVLAVQDQ
jgi:hypothetical protein